MRRVLTLPTRQLNASHDAEILLHKKHTDLEVFLGLLSIVLCVFSYNFIVIFHLIFTFFAEKIYHSISHSILSKNLRPRHLFFAPLSLFIFLFVILMSVLSISEHLGPRYGEQEKRRRGKGRRIEGEEEREGLSSPQTVTVIKTEKRKKERKRKKTKDKNGS